MNAHLFLTTPARSVRKPSQRSVLILTAATGIIVVVCAVLLADRLSARADAPDLVSSLPIAGSGRENAPPLLVDHSAVNWDKLPVAPNPSPLSVAAYED